jgi:hypothetical protein
MVTVVAAACREKNQQGGKITVERERSRDFSSANLPSPTSMRKSQIRCCLTAFLLHAAALRKAN